MKWNIDDLPVFVAISETGGITAASLRLEIPKSTVSRTLARLEDNLGIRLFDRNTRRLRPTSEGQTFLTHAKIILEGVAAANEEIIGLTNLPTGPLRISMPMGFSREIIGGRLAEFNKEFPEVILQVLVSPFNLNIMNEEIDVAVSVGPIENSEFIAHKIADTSLIWVASKDYASKYQWDEKISTLRPHLKFCERRYQKDRFVVKSPGAKKSIDMGHLMSVNDPVILRDITLQGGGVALLPALYCGQHLSSGDLVEVCPQVLPEQRATIFALTNSRRLQPKKTRVFIAFLKRCTQDYIIRTNTQSG